MNEKPLNVRLAEHIRSLRSDARILRGAAWDRYARGGEDPEWGGDPDWKRAAELDERADDLTVLLGGDAVLSANSGFDLTRIFRSPAQDASTEQRRAQRRAEPSALDLIALWLNDDRLHSDPGTLDDVFDAIRATGRYVAPTLKCCSHDDGYQGDPADLIADAKAALFSRILARTASAAERASAERMLENLLDLAEDSVTEDDKARIARETLGLPRPDQEDSR